MQPTAFGRYRIIKVVGRGGMGVVYEGHDPHIDRPVAIKTIALDALSDDERAMFEGRFRREMRSTGRLQHHNIAALYDTGHDGGTAYIVMELVAGQDLKRHLSAGRRFSVPEVVDITVQLLVALEFAHNRQVVHRDVKPANVILQPDGVVKLCDFGVASLTESDATRTRGMAVGSLRYSSPEQITGLPIDARTDVFSAGVLMYELLTAETPFKGQSDVEILHRIATQAAPSPQAIRADVPADIDGAVRRALAKDPAERFASAAEFARALGTSSITALDTQATVLALRPAVVAAAVAAGKSDDNTVAVKTAAVKTVAARVKWPVQWAAASGGVLVLAVGGWWALRPATTAQPQMKASPAAPASAQDLGPSAPTLALTSASASASASAVALAAPTSVDRASKAAPSAAPTITVAASVAPAAPAVAFAPVPAPAAAPAAAPTPALPPAPSLAPAPAPTPTRAPAPARPADGAWRGQLACGPSLAPGITGRASEAFTGALAVTINKSSITWTRQSQTFVETVAGTVDARSHFTAEGVGSRKDRTADWRVASKGKFVAKSNSLEAEVQLIRKSDGLVTRQCTMVAEPGSLPVPLATPAPAPATKLPAQVTLAVPQGAWTGELSCGAAQGVPATATRTEPFVAKVSLDVTGNRLSWLRESRNDHETATGTLDAKGLFRLEGTGLPKNNPQRSPWVLNAQGAFNAKDQRLSATVQMTRSTDGTVMRYCNLTAAPP